MANIFDNLKKLFSTNVIVRNVGGKKLKVMDTDGMQSSAMAYLKDKYTRLYSTQYLGHMNDTNMMAYQTVRLELFRDYDCISGDTIIPTPDNKNLTIKELATLYPTRDTKFYVFSYDHENDCVKLGEAHSARLVGKKETFKITFDDGKTLIATDDHPLLMRDGKYKLVKDSKAGESVMPFYRKRFYNNGYRHIYNFSEGWTSEHNLVAEQFDRELLESEVVHHKDFNCKNNLPNNLKIMDKKEHRSFHMKLNNEKIWSPENRQNQIDRIRESFKTRTPYKWNGKRSGENNPFYGKTHSKDSNLKRSNSLKNVFKNRNYNGESNGNYNTKIDFDLIKKESIDIFKNTGKITKKQLKDKLNCDFSLIDNRIKLNSTNWTSFKESVETTLNHKILSIEKYDVIDVYDLTVDVYHNFATDSCFVHNCMDKDPIIAAAVDIFADETTVPSEFGEVLTITSPNDDIKGILYNLFYDVLNIEFNLWPWVRNMVKYGDHYLVMEIVPEYGIHNVRPVSTYDMKRVENSDPTNSSYVYFQQESMGKDGKYENYQVAHFRLLSDSNWLPYGRSMIEPARRIWKQLSLMEDAMLIHRVMRAPQKRIFKVDVGNISPNEVDNHMKKYINGVKKTPYMDERTGDYNLKFNLQNMTEDYFLPVRGGDSGTEITDLAGMQWDGIDDVNYIKNKMFAALKVPKAFLNFDEGTSGKATLSAEDLRFARTISRIQKIIVSELKKIAMIHLYTQGYKDEELVNFELSLTNPSTIFEQEKISIWSEKVNLAKDMMENKLFSKKWIYQNVFNLSGDDIESERDSIVEDLKQSYRAKQIEEEGNDPAASFGDTGGEDTTGSEDISSELPSDMGSEPSGGSTGETGGGEASADTGGMPELPPLEEMVNLTETDKELPSDDDFKKWGKEGGLRGGGRPKGNQHRFNTKNHPLGADWNGHKSNKQQLKFDGSVRKKTAIDSMEKQLNELDKFINTIDKTLLKETKK